MAFRLYIVPLATQTPGNVLDNSRRPKYFLSDAAGAGHVGIIAPGTLWTAQDYGFEPWMIVGADLPTSDDNLVVGQSDAFAIPFDLSATLTGPQVTSVQNKLEAINLPAGWVTTALKWLDVVRIVLGMFSLMTKYYVIHGPNGLFAGGSTLSTAINALPAQVRTDFAAAANALGLNSSGITGATTVRAALKIYADQMQQVQYQFSPTVSL